MRLSRSSFRVRLIFGAIIWITAGLGMSWWVLAQLFRDHAMSEFADELDHHATELINLLELDASGHVRLRVPLSDHRFMGFERGYYWQVERPDGDILRSISLGSARLKLTLGFGGPWSKRQGRMPGPHGEVLLLERVIALGDATETARIAVAMDLQLTEDFLATFKRTLGIALGTIALGLIAAAFAQISIGLWPLGRVRQALLAVRRGEAKRLPENLPDEVLPLAHNVNALLDVNEDMIRRARVQAGNLAHALKTPLALLLDEGRRLEAAGLSGALVIEQSLRMRRQIDHQLAKTRAEASRVSSTNATLIGPAIGAITATVARLHRDRGLAFEVVNDTPATVVACGTEDLDEILGNLIENAAKWARSQVRVVVAVPRDRFVRITVEDDGPGIPADARDRVFNVGERLDEQVAGTGLGLTIVRDVVGLYGGATGIGDSCLGGAAVFVELPVDGKLIV